MENLIKLPDVNDKIICIRNENVILSNDVAELYGVETREINQAIKNNPDKFPEGYVLETSQDEKIELIKNFDRFERLKHSSAFPTAFTEKGLYMLATILKSPQATQTTIAIVETFAKLKQLSNNIVTINSMDVDTIEPEIIESTGRLLDEILFSGLPTLAETSFEFNLGVMKGKRIVKSENPNVVHHAHIMQNEIDELKKIIAGMNERLEKLIDS
ncbi:MAG: ORF6N domain-containing protein [Bacteroidales bacterium]|jgi:phage regulator Rha-like protein|nr:ORF6N domain-containing protein [Bacteroidales bacterium]